MHRSILKASPAAIRRAAEVYRPIDQRRPPIAERKPAADQHRLDLADRERVERKDSNSPE